MIFSLVFLLLLLQAPRGIHSKGPVVYEADSQEWTFVTGQPTRVRRGQLHDVSGDIAEQDARAAIVLSGPDDVVSLKLEGLQKISLFGVIFPLEGVTGPCSNPTISNLEVSPRQALSDGGPGAHDCNAVCDTVLASYSLGDSSLGDTVIANFSTLSKIAITSAIVTLQHHEGEQPSVTFLPSLTGTPSQTSPFGAPTSSQNIQPAVPEISQCIPILCDSPPPKGGLAPVATVPARSDGLASQSGRDAGTSTSSTPPRPASIFGSNSLPTSTDPLRSRAPPIKSTTVTLATSSASAGAAKGAAVSPARVSRTIKIAVSAAVGGGVVLGLFFVGLVFYLRRRRQQDARASVSSYTLVSPSEVAPLAVPPPGDKARALKDAWDTPLVPTASGSRSRSLPVASGSDDAHAETRSLPPRYGAWRF